MQTYTIHQIQQVKNRTVVVQLPEDFPTDEVKITIQPVYQRTPLTPLSMDKMADSLHRFLTLDTSHFTDAQKQAYERACIILQRGRKADEPRILGLFAGLGEISEDFDAPLSDEYLFLGEETNEYGIKLD